MVKTKEEILNSIRTRFDSVDNEAIAIIEDINDTFDDLESKQNSGEDWEAKYKENDEMWRKKYTDRFFNKDSEDDDDDPDPIPEPKNEPKRFEDLFTINK